MDISKSRTSSAFLINMVLNNKTTLMLTQHALDHCPVPWQNFVLHYNPDGETSREIDRALVEYNAKIIKKSNTYVKFKSVEDKTRFLLTWS